MAIIRLILGKLILLFNRVFTPMTIDRNPEQQDGINLLVPCY
jgi:hypothetical protein